MTPKSGRPNARGNDVVGVSQCGRGSRLEAFSVVDGGFYGEVGDGELGEDVGDVHAGGLGRDEQLGADLAVGLAPGEQPEHVALAVGQRFGQIRAGRGGRGSAAGGGGGGGRPGVEAGASCQGVEGGGERDGAQVGGGGGGGPPDRARVVGPARLDQRLGQPPLAAGGLVD